MFLSSNKKNNVYPCKPQFHYIKVGFKRSNLYRFDFVMRSSTPMPFLKKELLKKEKFDPPWNKLFLFIADSFWIGAWDARRSANKTSHIFFCVKMETKLFFRLFLHENIIMLRKYSSEAPHQTTSYVHLHYKPSLFKCTENFTTKNESFQIKIQICVIFLLKNIDCGTH